MRQQITHFTRTRQVETLPDGHRIITWQGDWTRSRWVYQLRVISPLGSVVFGGDYSRIDYATRELRQQRNTHR